MWDAVLVGHRDQVRYVLEVAAAEGADVVTAPAATSDGGVGLRCRGGAATTLLDACATARCGVVLTELVEDIDVTSPFPAVAGAGTVRFWRRATGWRAISSIRRAAVAVAFLAVTAGVAAAAMTRLHPASTAPPAGAARSLPDASTALLPTPQFGAALAYDAAHGTTVLFGGIGAWEQTWLWSGGVWRLTRPSSSPPGRYGAASAYDPAMREVLLFGGQEIGHPLFTDTWSWDGSTWTRLRTAVSPPGDESTGMAYDDARGEMVLVTGCCGGNGAAQTWIWDGSRWSQRRPITAPPSTSRAVAYDPHTRTVLLVTDDATLSTTWSWDGTVWTRLSPLHDPPPGFPMTMARDPASGDLVLLTVASLRRVAARAAPAQTWTWDGHDWSQRDPAVQPPYPAGLVADTRDGALVVLGRPTTGGGATDLALRVAATWTGTTWLRLGTGRTTSPGRSG